MIQPVEPFGSVARYQPSFWLLKLADVTVMAVPFSASQTCAPDRLGVERTTVALLIVADIPVPKSWGGTTAFKMMRRRSISDDVLFQ